MWFWKSKAIDKTGFERIETEIFCALEASEAEIEAAANSPFLYQRIRARLEAETKQRNEPGKEWLAWLATARLAAPALALVALLAIGVFWTVGKSGATTSLSAAGNTEVSLAGELSLSNDELLVELVGWQENGIGTASNSVKEQ
jgi:hypothetical protein